MNNNLYLTSIVLSLMILTGCSSTQPRDSGTGEKLSRSQNFKQNLENVGKQAGTVSKDSIDGENTVSEKCKYASIKHKRLLSMRKKAEEKTIGDGIVSMFSNPWALIPIPFADKLSMMNQDQDELGIYNKEGCWTTKCINKKILGSKKAIDKYCVSNELKPLQ